MFITAQLDLTNIGELIREHQYLAKKVEFRDGKTHQLLTIVIGDRKEPDKNGNNITINCKPKDMPHDNKYYIGTGKLWPDRNQSQPAPAQATVPADSSAANDPDLPF